MIKVTCPHCGLAILVPAAVQGNQGCCFACGKPLMVPYAGGDNMKWIDFTPGTRIADRYEIVKCIGRGGMAIVYSARDHLIREPVALKFIHPRLVSSQQGQLLFLREAQVARRLRHDNIVAVHDIGRTEEGVLYLSMELLRGETLRHLLIRYREQKKFPPVTFAFRVMFQLLDALSYAHRFVVHRDLKPENIMVSPGEHIKILDFGLARAFDREKGEKGDTRGKERFIGTEAYAAPEQKQHREIDFRADIYAAGLIFRELLTLRVPFEPVASLDEVRGDIAPSLVPVLEKALQERREERWQSTRTFKEALQEVFVSSYQHQESVELVRPANGTVSLEGMIYLEGGSFMMGDDSLPVARPRFEAHVEPFYMDKFPVTVGQYARYLEATGAPHPRFWGEDGFSNDDQPVVGVSWEQARAYAHWCGKALPSEAEWEFAARGKENRRYPWGMAEPDRARANYGEHLNMPTLVGMFEEGATPDGIQELAGNVYEWTRDWFVPYGDSRKKVVPRRAVRGGCWRSPPHELRTVWRGGFFPEAQEPFLGFRCVVPVNRLHRSVNGKIKNNA